MVSQAVYSFFRDMGAPLALGLLAYVVQLFQQDRERQEKRRQQARAELQLLDPRDGKCVALRYLMPISSATAQLVKHVRDYQDLGENDLSRETVLRRSFYYFLHLMEKMRELTHEAGGFFFRNLKGESVANHCWTCSFRESTAQLGYADLSEVLDVLGDAETLTVMEDRLF